MVKTKKTYFYRMVFYPPKTEKERAKVFKMVISIVNNNQLPYYYNLSNGGYEIQFIGDETIIQDDLVDEKTEKDLGKVEAISEKHFWHCKELMKKHMESKFIPESEYQKMSSMKKYNHLKKMIESFVLKYSKESK